MVEGGMKCVKYLLFAFNVVFVLAAIALIVIGALVQTKFHDYFDFFGEKFSGAAILFIVVGVIIFIIASFGCCGAIRENYICTMVFAGLLTVIFILEIAGGIAGFVLRDKIRAELEVAMQDGEKNFNQTGHGGVTKTWNTVQTEFSCCGIVFWDEWESTTFNHVPKSCCKNADFDCTIAPTNETVYTTGCLESFGDWAENNIYIIGAVGIALAFVQVLGIVFACCMARSIRKEYEVV